MAPKLAPIDGASFTVDRPGFTATVFGGRRFSFFADPYQRAIGGANVTFKIDPDTSFKYEGMWYMRGNKATFRRRINPHWLFSSYFRAYGGSPVDFNAQGLYDSGNGKTSLQLSFFQKLSNKDYTSTSDAATDLDPHNPLLRLYLGPEEHIPVRDPRPADNFFDVSPGRSVWVRRLDNKKDEGPFDTSFEDYRVNSQIFPGRGLETFLEYHQRNSDRLSPLILLPSMISRYRRDQREGPDGRHPAQFREGASALSGGVYYRRISLQDRFTI